MKRIIPFLLLVFLLSGCAEFKQLEFGNVDVNSIKFINTTTMSIKVAVQVNNPVDKNLVLESFDALIYNEGKTLADFTLIGNPIAAAGKRTVVPIEIEARAIDYVTLIAMGLNYNSWNIDAMTVNGKIALKFENGQKKTIKFKNKPLKSIISILK